MTQAPSFGADDMLHSGTTMHHAPDDDEQFDPLSVTPEFVQDDEPLPEPDPRDDENPYDSFLGADAPPLDNAADMLERKKRSNKAVSYERKVQGLFAVGVKLTITNPRSLADSAAMMLHGPGIAEKAGDLAAVNPKAAAIIDAITDQTESPTTALIMASVPFALQILRNHEVVVMDEARPRRTVKLLRWQLRLPRMRKLPKRIRNLTQDPLDMTAKVLRDANIQAALEKQGIHLVYDN